MNMEQVAERQLVEKAKVLEDNLPQWFFAHQKSIRPDMRPNPIRRGGKPATNPMSAVFKEVTKYAVRMTCISILMPLDHKEAKQLSS
jgi:hypothetical protein